MFYVYLTLQQQFYPGELTLEIIWCRLLACLDFNPRQNSEVTWVKIAGALKNVLAIAAGYFKGMSLGNNSMDAHSTRMY